MSAVVGFITGFQTNETFYPVKAETVTLGHVDEIPNKVSSMVESGSELVSFEGDEYTGAYTFDEDYVVQYTLLGFSNKPLKL